MKDEKRPEKLHHEPSGRNIRNKITKYKHKSGVLVKRNKRKSPSEPRRPTPSFKLRHLIFKREPDENFYGPLCARCGFPILDFAMANISVWNESDDFKLTPLGWQQETNCHVFLADDDVYAFHKECDNTPSGSPWISADYVFKSDQRYSFEKTTEADEEVHADSGTDDSVSSQRARTGGTE